jgi:hypothetical protein
MLVKSHFASIERAKGSSGGSEESDAEIEGKSKSRQRQHTPAYLTENRTQKIAECWRNYISRPSKNEGFRAPIRGSSRMRRWGGKSESQQRQHTPAHLAENRTQKIAEYWRNYISLWAGTPVETELRGFRRRQRSGERLTRHALPDPETGAGYQQHCRRYG